MDLFFKPSAFLILLPFFFFPLKSEAEVFLERQVATQKRILQKFGISASRFREVKLGVADASSFGGIIPQGSETIINTLTPIESDATAIELLSNISSISKRNIEGMKRECAGAGQQLLGAFWQTMVLSKDRIDSGRAYVGMTVRIAGMPKYREIDCIFGIDGKLIEQHSGVAFEAENWRDAELPGKSESGEPYACNRSSNNSVPNNCIHIKRSDDTEQCSYEYQDISLHYQRRESLFTMCYADRQLTDEEANDCSYIISAFRHWLEKAAMLAINEPIDSNRNFGEKIEKLSVHFGYKSLRAEYIPLEHQIHMGRDLKSFCQCPDLVLHELFHAFFVSKIMSKIITWEGRLLTELISDIGGLSLAHKIFPKRYSALADGDRWHLAHICTNHSGLRNRNLKEPKTDNGYYKRYDEFVKNVLKNPSFPFAIVDSAYKGSTIFSHVFYNLAVAPGQENDSDQIFYLWLITAVSHFYERISLPEVACRLVATIDGMMDRLSNLIRKELLGAGFDVSPINCASFPRNDCELADVKSAIQVKEIRYEGDYRAYVLCNNRRVLESNCDDTRQWSPNIETICQPVVQHQPTCQPPNPPENGFIRPLNDGKETFLIGCNKGFELNGQKIFSCGDRPSIAEAPATCTPEAPPPTECQPPKPIPNGHVNILSPGLQAVYECNEGYEMSGSPLISCEKEVGEIPSWSDAPTCGCGPPPPYPYEFAQLNYETSSRARYECSEGYVMQGDSNIIVCRSDGEWTKPAFKCIQIPTTTEKPCVPAESETPVNGVWRRFPGTDWFELICNEGFVHKAFTLRYANCRHTTATNSTCEKAAVERKCAVPEQPENGVALFHFHLPGSIAVFTCNSGFQFSNGRQSMTVTCLFESLEWSQKPGKCEPISTTTTTTTTSSKPTWTEFSPDVSPVFPLDCEWVQRHRANPIKPNGWTEEDSSKYFLDGCRGGNLTIVSDMIGKWGPQLVDMGDSREDGWSRTCLIYAARNNHKDIGQFLVEQQGANVNTGNGWHQRSIHSAANRGYLGIVRYLAERGAKVNVIDDVVMLAGGKCRAGEYSRTPLDWAIRSKRKAVADYLISIGGRCYCLVSELCMYYQSTDGLGWGYCPE